MSQSHWLLLGWSQDLEAANEVIVDRHHGAGVVKLSAVVWSRKQRHQLPFSKKLVPVFHDLLLFIRSQ